MPVTTSRTAAPSTTPKLSTGLRRAILATTGLLLVTSPAYAVDDNALPTGGVVAIGGATFTTPTANQLNVNQSTQNVVIDWNSFDIGRNATTQFVQPNAQALAVNRVNDVNPSQILGNLNANGKIVVLNSNGVVFGQNAKVDVAGLLVSTGTLDTTGINATGTPTINLSGINAKNATVQNDGNITVGNAGIAAFVAPNVVNNGVIKATLGKIALAGGADRATVDMYGDGLVEMTLDDKASKAVITNTGTLTADGGQIAITARAAAGIVDSSINIGGVVEADTFQSKDGVITLSGNDADIKVTGSIYARGNKGRVAATSNRKVSLAKTAKVNVDNGAITVDGIVDSGAATLRANSTGTINITQRAGGKIQDAVNAFDATAAQAKIVTVAPGTYEENVTISASGITLLSSGGRDVTIINGNQAGGEEGAIYITTGANNTRIGDVGQGFTINGLNGNGTSEKSAVYIKGNNTGSVISGNTIVARGDSGLTTEYGGTVDNMTISGNIFSGQTFEGANPSGSGSSTQFNPGNNVPRQLVVMGGGNGGGNTSNITFTDNVLQGTTGGFSTDRNVNQGNFLATIDAKTATIKGNTFNGTTTGNGLFRARGINTTIADNIFDGAKMSGTADYVLVNGSTFASTGTANMDALYAANTFLGNTAYASTSATPASQLVSTSIQKAIFVAANGTDVHVSGGTFNENVTVNKNVRLLGNNTDIDPVATPDSRRVETILTNSGTGFNITANSVTIDGFSFNSGRGGTAVVADNVADTIISNNIVTGGQRGITSTNGTRINITGNAIANINQEGIRVLGNTDTVVINGNSVTDTGADGIYVQGGGLQELFTFKQLARLVDPDGNPVVSVDGNTVTNAGNNGIRLDNVTNGNGFSVSSNTVSNSDVDNIGITNSSNGNVSGNTVVGGGNGINADSNSNLSINANTITTPGSNGILVTSNAGTLDIAGNTIATTGGNGIDLRAVETADIADNIITGNINNGIYTTGTNGLVTLINNNVTSTGTGIGAYFQSGEIDLSGAANTFTGGTDGVVFDQSSVTNVPEIPPIIIIPGGPGSGGPIPDLPLRLPALINDVNTLAVLGADSLTLTGNTLGTTVLAGQSGDYVRLVNGALFNSDNTPIDIDANAVSFDRYVPNADTITQADLDNLNLKIRDYNDGDNVGRLFFTANLTPVVVTPPATTPPATTPTTAPTTTPVTNNAAPGTTTQNAVVDFNDILPQQQIAGLAGSVGGSVTITGLPYASLARVNNTAAGLADIAPAAGGNNSAAFSAESLNDIDSAAGGDGRQAGCWGQVYNTLGRAAVTYSLNDAPTSQLSDQATCTAAGV